MMVAVNYTKSWSEGGLGGVVVEVNLRSKCSQPVAFPHSPSPTRYTNPEYTEQSMKPNRRQLPFFDPVEHHPTKYGS